MVGSLAVIVVKGEGRVLKCCLLLLLWLLMFCFHIVRGHHCIILPSGNLRQEIEVLRLFFVK